MQVTVTSPADIGRLTTEIYLHQPRITNSSRLLSRGNDLLCKTGGNGRTRDAANLYPRRVLTLPDLQEQLRLHPHDPMLRYRVAFARVDGMW